MHRETKELPIYALVLAKKDNQLGLRLTDSKERGCAQFDPSQASTIARTGQTAATGVWRDDDGA